jgi:septal ring factor EnvC (AmiA/AmiB activator)
MSRISHLLLFLLTVFTLSTVAMTVIAGEKQVKQKQLKAIQSKIKKIKTTIDVKEDSKSRYASQLQKIEKSIGSVAKKIRNIEKQIGQSKTELKSLRKTRKKHQKQLVEENETLSEQVYAAYTLGKQERIKLLFSQKSAANMQRNLVYYQYFSNARVNLINDVQENITTILSTESSISLASQALEKNYQQLKTQKTQLSKDGAKRKTIIGSLDKQIKKQGGHLNQLQDEASQLQSLIESIEKMLIETPEPELSREAFAKLRGKLAWPVNGKVKRLFGRHKPLSDLRWQGIIIEAPTGRHVKSISHGRVAFADWLRGMGNLIIIDHGNSYLSLYGHNESLFKTAGEWVEPGDIISSIGNSGGQAKSGLYFEIRKKGKPQNPSKWCKTGVRFASG